MKWHHDNFENASVQMLQRRRRLIALAAITIDPKLHANRFAPVRHRPVTSTRPIP